MMGHAEKLAVILGLLCSLAIQQGHCDLDEVNAVAILKGDSDVQGIVEFSQGQLTDPVLIQGTITGLSPGLHGFHVHEKGDLRNGCTSTGAHFNPYHETHGAPTDLIRHVGDLGNIVAGNDGVATFSFTDEVINLYGPNSILGRAILVHKNVDDLGRGNNAESKKTGNAGARLACGLIGYA